MKVDLTSVNDVERRLTVCIPSGKVSDEIDKAYLELKKTVKLKGFRPGKAPLALLQRHFKAQIEEDVISRLIKQTYPSALDEVKAAPLAQPKIENGVLEKGKEFSYTALFETKPEIDVTGYTGLELERDKADTITDEELAKELDALRNSFATLEDVDDRPVATGDYVVCDIEGAVDGRSVGSLSRKEFLVEVGSDSFLPGFSDNLTGLGITESRTFDLTVPGDYEDGEIAGKTIQCAVVIKAIKKKNLPELNDEFAKDVGEYATLEALKEKIKQSLFEKKQSEAETKLKEKIFDMLIEKNSFTVPTTLVEAQARNMILDMQNMLQARGLSIEDMGQNIGQLFERYKEPAQRQVRTALLLGAIADKEGITADDAEIEKKYEEIAAQVGQDLAAVKAKVEPGMIRPQILEKKAMDFIMDHAVITEK